MTTATTSSTSARPLFRHMPLLSLALAAVAVALLAAGPIGWRTGWLHYRFALLNLLPWAGYVGLVALVVSAFTLIFSRSRIGSRGVLAAMISLVVGALVAYVPWHYHAMRDKRPSDQRHHDGY